MNANLHRFAATGLAALLIASAASAQTASDPNAKPKAGSTPISQRPTSQSLAEQATYAEEHTRDFDKAAELYSTAAQLAVQEGDLQRAKDLEAARVRVLARKAGVPAGAVEFETSAMEGRVMQRIYQISLSQHDSAADTEAYRDLALLGAIAVPWLEKAVAGPYTQAGHSIEGDPRDFVKAIAMMSAPEGQAALDRLLASTDPLVRRAVAEFADPDRHRTQLLRELKDPADGVRERALITLAGSDDLKLTDVMRTAARSGAREPLQWVLARDPAYALQLAADKSLSSDFRADILNVIRHAKRLVPSSESIDALLAIARERTTIRLRESATEVLFDLAKKPLTPENAKRIEDDILAHLGDYPFPASTSVLLRVGGPASLSLVVEQVASGNYLDNGELLLNFSRILSRCGPTDFSAVAGAFGKFPPQLRNLNSTGNFLRPGLQGWLSAVVDQGIESEAIARAARSMEPLIRREFMQEVAMPWIGRIPVRQHNAKIPAIDPGLLALVRELPANASTEDVHTRAIVMGASGDPETLPELVAMVSPGGVDSYVQWAIRRVAGKDSQRWRIVIEQLMASESASTSDLTKTFRELIGERQPAEILALAKSMWTPASAEKLAALVVESVPGPDGSAFLLANYAQLPLVASEVRAGIIRRLAQEFYEPATALIGEALRDSDDKVRREATVAFGAFRQNRQVVSEFEAWTRDGAQREKTASELLAMLDSPNSNVLIAAVKALGALKLQAAYPKLIGLLETHGNDAALVAAVQAAVERMGQ